MDKKQIINLKSRFDAIAHFDEAEGIEFWYARELQSELGYTEWRNFTKVIKKAKISLPHPRPPGRHILIFPQTYAILRAMERLWLSSHVLTDKNNP